MSPRSEVIPKNLREHNSLTDYKLKTTNFFGRVTTEFPRSSNASQAKVTSPSISRRITRPATQAGGPGTASSSPRHLRGLDYHYPMHEMRSFDTGSDSYYASLKKVVPNVFTGSQLARQEVMILGNWMLETLGKINSDLEINMTTRLKRADEVYTLCLTELIREVSCDCLERGQLFTQIWKAYLDLKEDIVREYKDKEIEIENKALGDYNRVNELFKK
jgi:hypothetical protein